MTNYYICSDNIDRQERNYMQRIASVIQSAGHSIEVGSVGPSTIQARGLRSSSKGTVGIFLVGGIDIGMLWDFIQSYYHYDKFVVAFASWTAHSWITESDLKSRPLVKAWDDNYSGNRASSFVGKTAFQIFSEHSDRLQMAYGDSPEALAQMILSGSPTSSSSSSNQSQSNVSPLLTGDMTFEELVGEICNGIDLLFLVKRGTIVVTDFESIYAEAKYLRDKYPDSVKGENINLWQIEQDSFEMEVNQIGFYNTVYVHYKDGIVRESYDDLVRVYGEVPVTYYDSSVDKTTAIMKAKAYLAAHLRDFEMTVNATILTEPDIEIGDIVTIKNPKTLQNDIRTAEGRDPEFLFVNGVSTNWEGDSAIMTDIECKFAPTSPNKLDVPTSGNGDGNSQSSGASGSFNSCGVSSDGTQVKAIGKASAPGETSTYGSGFYESVFENMCPFCQKPTLAWDIFWAGNETSNWGFSSCRGASEGSSAEGAVFCKSCDADFSVFGHNHVSGSSVSLNRISGPTPSSKEAVYKLKGGG